MSNKKDIGTHISNRLNDLKATPEPEVWNAIESRLNQQKKTKRTLFLLFSALVIVIIFIGLQHCVFNTEAQNTPAKLQLNNTEHNSIVNQHKKEQNQELILQNEENESNQKSRQIIATKKRQNFNNSAQKSIRNKRKTTNLTPKKSQLSVTNSFAPLTLHNINSKKNDSVSKADTTKNWSIGLTNGISHFNSWTDGNTLNNNLTNNPKSNNFSYNFGLTINYHTENVAVRIGFHKLRLQYQINAIQIAGNSPQLNSIYDIDQMVSNYNNSLAELFNNDPEIELSQEINYSEFPIELLIPIHSKIKNLNLIAGFSTLYVNNNFIYGSSKNTQKFRLGYVDSVSRVNFSFNTGMNYQLKLNEAFYLNSELQLKQYFNTYNKKYGVAPFTIGLQFGVNYRF